jgi:hypothetical protein
VLTAVVFIFTIDLTKYAINKYRKEKERGVLLQRRRRQQRCFGQHDGQQYQLHHLKQHVDQLQRHIVVD